MKNKNELTSAHFDVIANHLDLLYQKASEKWTKCSWKHEIGQFGQINLKNMTSTDLDILLEQAEASWVASLKELSVLATRTSNAGDLHGIVSDLFAYLDLVMCGPDALNYLRNVEHCAKEADATAVLIINEIREGNIKTAANKLDLLAVLEDVRESGKPVWQEFRNTAATYVFALQCGWTPRVLVTSLPDYEKVYLVLGSDSQELDDLYLPETWSAYVGTPPQTEIQKIFEDDLGFMRARINNKTYVVSDGLEYDLI